MQKVDYRRAFAQEFRVRYHVETRWVHAVAMQHPANPLVGINGHRAFLHDHLVCAHGTGDGGNHSLDIREVGRAGISLWSADCNKYGFAFRYRRGKIAGRSEEHTSEPSHLGISYAVF